MKRVPTVTGESTKLQDHYRGPLVIIELLQGDIYSVAELDQTKNSRYATMAHVSQLKSWRIYRGDEQMEDDDEETIEKCGCSETIGRKEAEKMSETVQGRFSRVRKPPVWHADYCC
ncbi:unnamed protein product [Macrosiphum euphorbiae]|uniref:Uncharacterized protein n=1 Tax=Macrosiphum euphorbiae TaxID=13131 RepID=A0AAV0WR19_9HEMI|nr:unnamed protein product [Macrosiphum euphorbiae]